jgi:hypothetical protein
MMAIAICKLSPKFGSESIVRHIVIFVTGIAFFDATPSH